MLLRKTGLGVFIDESVDGTAQVGTVHRVTERGDIRVQFSDGSLGQRWTFHPRAIHRLAAFAVGDAVRLSDDADQVRRLQRGHGEWIDVMRQV